MDWHMENTKDEAMLKRLDLTPLDNGAAGEDGNLAAFVGTHNAKLTKLRERLEVLAADRSRLTDADGWLDLDSVDISSQRSRLLRESWDAMLALRKLLTERQVILGRLENTIGNRLSALRQRREQVVTDTRKALSKVRKEHLRVNPHRGEAHFTDLVESQDAVVAIDQQIAATQATLEAVASARRKTSSDMSAVTNRQREVFGVLVS